MKKIALAIFFGVLSVGLLFNLSSGQTCNPAESVATCCDSGGLPFGYAVDLGTCDTLFVRPYPTTDTCITYIYPNAGDPYTETHCINTPGSKFPCFMYVNLLMSHDSNSFFGWSGQPEERWMRDSIAAMIIPLGWTRTNPAKYCSLSTYWNENTVLDDPDEEGYPYPRRIWRNFPPLGSDSLNLMDKLKWATMVVELSSDSVLADGTPPHAFFSLIAGTKRKWRQQTDTLLATLTFRVQDTMHIYMDTTAWPPSNGKLQFVRYDAASYMPRVKGSKLLLSDPDYPGIWIKSDGSVTSVEDFYQLPDIIPKEFALSQNYPNPFNPTTTIEFAITKSGDVTIEIFNALGQRVETLVNKRLNPGTYRVNWNAGNLASGVYFCRMKTPEEGVAIIKTVLLK